jgi:hypothetical protein
MFQGRTKFPREPAEVGGQKFEQEPLVIHSLVPVGGLRFLFPGIADLVQGGHGRVEIPSHKVDAALLEKGPGFALPPHIFVRQPDQLFQFLLLFTRQSGHAQPRMHLEPYSQQPLGYRTVFKQTLKLLPNLSDFPA